MPRRAAPRKAPEFARVLALEAETAWLWQCGVVRRQAVPPLVRVGDWIDSDTGELAARGGPGFPHPDGDFHRISQDGGRRWLAIIARARLLQAIRQFFDRRGFIEVDTPAIALSPGLELHLDAVQVQVRQGMGGPATSRYLVTSPEYHCKRLLAAGMPKIYSLAKAFRSGERGHWHNPEFTMLEWYRAGATYLDIVRDARALVAHCEKALEPLKIASRPKAVSRGWQRLSIAAALKRWAGFDPRNCNDDEYMRQKAQQFGLNVQPTDTAAEVVLQALVERVEPNLTNLSGVVIDRWPASMASLARRFADTPQWAERFEIYVGGIELANGFTELVDAEEQQNRFVLDQQARLAHGLPVYPIDERFVAALREGCPPAAGVALGVDRLLMILAGFTDIDDVLFFPFERA